MTAPRTPHPALGGEAVGDPADRGGQAPFVEVGRGERAHDPARLLQPLGGTGLDVLEQLRPPLGVGLGAGGPGEQEQGRKSLGDAVVDVTRETGPLARHALGPLHPGQLVGEGGALLLRGVERGDEALALDAVADQACCARATPSATTMPMHGPMIAA